MSILTSNIPIDAKVLLYEGQRNSAWIEIFALRGELEASRAETIAVQKKLDRTLESASLLITEEESLDLLVGSLDL